MRKTKFANDEYYHIYNRGTDKREIFCNEKDYLRFLVSLREFNNVEPVGSLYEKNYRDKKIADLEAELPIGSSASKSAPLPLIDIIAYCLILNHEHLILKQLVENGISKFMHKLDTGYTKYFNHKYDRSGSLFQGRFKATHIDTNEYLLWLSGYVNGNAEIHKIIKAENYKWCSYQDYLGKRDGTLCNKEIILSQFKNLDEYTNYVNMVIEESSKRKDLEKYFIEEI